MTMVSVIIVSIWKVIGYYMVIFSAGIKTIPDTYYEAGPHRWRLEKENFLSHNFASF